jgi:hypothetical protein
MLRNELRGLHSFYVENNCANQYTRKAVLEIVPGLVESGGSRRTACYSTWTC